MRFKRSRKSRCTIGRRTLGQTPGADAATGDAATGDAATEDAATEDAAAGETATGVPLVAWSSGDRAIAVSSACSELSRRLKAAAESKDLRVFRCGYGRLARTTFAALIPILPSFPRVFFEVKQKDGA